MGALRRAGGVSCCEWGQSELGATTYLQLVHSAPGIGLVQFRLLGGRFYRLDGTEGVAHQQGIQLAYQGVQQYMRFDNSGEYTLIAISGDDASVLGTIQLSVMADRLVHLSCAVYNSSSVGLACFRDGAALPSLEPDDTVVAFSNLENTSKAISVSLEAVMLVEVFTAPFGESVQAMPQISGNLRLQWQSICGAGFPCLEVDSVLLRPQQAYRYFFMGGIPAETMLIEVETRRVPPNVSISIWSTVDVSFRILFEGRLADLTDWHKHRYAEQVAKRLRIPPVDVATIWSASVPPQDVVAGVAAESRAVSVCPRLFREMVRELREAKFWPLDSFMVRTVEDTTPTTSPSMSPALTQVPTVFVPTFWNFEEPTASGADRFVGSLVLSLHMLAIMAAVL
jgi:hypothetical protein